MKLHEIIDQVQEIYEGDPWYGNTLQTLFKRLTPEMLNYTYGGHSVGQILEHMITWRVQVIRKLKGQPDNVRVDSTEDWNPETAADLQMLMADFQETQMELIALLSTKSDELLDQQVPGKDYTFEYLLIGIIQHDLYHLGQLYLLIK